MRTTSRRPAAAVAIVSLALTAACAPDETPVPATGSLLDLLPKDPLAAVVVSLDDPAAAYDTLDSLYRLAARATGTDPTALDRQRSDETDSLGISVGDDLLAALGPGVALSVDVPPFDLLAGLLMQGSPDLVVSAMGRIGLIAQTTDPQALRAALRAMLERNGATISTDGGMDTARFPMPAAVRDLLPPNLPVSEVALHYLAGDGLLAVGFDPEWLQDALAPRPVGERLPDGADFRRVFGPLADQPLSVVYINLPGLRSHLESSTVAQLAISGNPDWQRLWRSLNDRLDADIGLGQTTVRAEGRTVHTTHGPGWVPGLADLVGAAAALLPPRALARAERARQDATVARMRALAAGIEAYALDHNAYPNARRIERLRVLLEPAYVEVTPIYDGWGNPLRVLGTRSGYTVCSGGRDGGDCSFIGDGGATPGLDDAIILQNGAFVQWPERLSGILAGAARSR